MQRVRDGKLGAVTFGVWLSAVAACGGPARPTTAGAGVGSGAGTSNALPPLPAPWTASTGGTWRTAQSIRGVASLDAHRAIVLLADHTVAVLDTNTGTLGAPTPLDVGTTPGSLRLVAAGPSIFVVSEKPTAAKVWKLDEAALSVTPVPLEADAAPMANLAVSAAGDEVVACAGASELVIRDAVTWQLRQRLAQPCKAPWLVGADEVVPDVAARTVSYVHRVSGAVRTELRTKVQDLPPSAGAVVVDGGATVTPRYHYLEVTGGPAPRRIDMPTTTYRPLNRPRPGAPLVVQLGWTSLGAVDLATGALRTDTSRNLGDVHHLVVGGGVVYAAADRLRRWERGALVASTDLAAEALAGHPPLGPIWLVADDTLLAWDGSAGAPRSLAEASAADIIDASPTEAIFTNLYDLYRVRPGAAPERWFTFHEDAYLADLDASTGRLLLSTDGGVSIVAPDEERVIGVANDDCWSPSFPRLARGIERAVIDAEAAVRVYDTASGRLVGSLDTADTVTLDAEFLGPDAGTLAVLIEDAVLLWPIGAARAARWTLPLTASPVTLAASSDGLELAIGFDDGSLAWTTVADARAAATSLRVHAAAAPTACDDGSTAVTTLDDLRGTSLEDEDDEDDWCDGGDCGAE